MMYCKEGIFVIKVNSVSPLNKQSYYQRKSLFSNKKKQSKFQSFQNVLKEELKKEKIKAEHEHFDKYV